MDATTTQTRQADAGHGISFAEAFRVWLRVALLSFGGPAGQIAVMHRILVDEKNWISESRFLHALNYCMLLPGPEAQQLATYIGWLLHRTAGGIMAGGLFILPGIIAIMGLSYIYAAFGNVGYVEALFFGLKAAVLAIVIQAVVRVGKRALRNRIMIALAAIAFIAIFFFNVPFPIIIISAGLTGYAGAFCGGEPSYRAVFPDVSIDGGTCATVGVLGTAVAVLGSVQAHLALHLLLGLEPTVLGRVITFDAKRLTFGGFGFEGSPEPEQFVPFIAPDSVTADDLVVDLRSLEVLAYGGSPMAPELVQRTRQLLPKAKLLQCYGLSETGFLTGLQDQEHIGGRLVSCGRSCPGIDLRVEDETGKEVEVGQHGELVARGANVMRGYWNDPQDTALAFRNGMFRTGDIGYQDSDGYFYILDRLKDMIVTGGENVYSGEVESVIYKHPAVREVAVFGIPDSQWGELVMACVVLKPGMVLSANDLTTHCRQLLANYKIPRRVEFSDSELPKSGSGKILKRILRERFWAHEERAVR